MICFFTQSYRRSTFFDAFFLSFLEPDSSSPHSFLLYWKMAIRIFRRNKVIWVRNNLRMSKWQNFFFILGWSIPFHWGCVVQNMWCSGLYCSLFQKKNISDINWSCDLWKSRSSFEIYLITQRLIVINSQLVVLLSLVLYLYSTWKVFQNADPCI